MTDKYLVVHAGTGTIIDLDECRIIMVDIDEEATQNAIDDNDIDALVKIAGDTVWEGELIPLYPLI